MERCWRAQIVVRLTPGLTVDRAMLEAMRRLRVLIEVGDAGACLDEGAARDRSVELLSVAGALASGPVDAQDLCTRIVRAIDYYLGSLERGEETS